MIKRPHACTKSSIENSPHIELRPSEPANSARSQPMQSLPPNGAVGWDPFLPVSRDRVSKRLASDRLTSDMLTSARQATGLTRRVRRREKHVSRGRGLRSEGPERVRGLRRRRQKHVISCEVEKASEKPCFSLALLSRA